jgi:hypothetical protein
MKTSEIISLIEEKSALAIDYRMKAYELQKELNDLNIKKRKSLLCHFSNYLQLGDTYTFTQLTYLTGNQIASKDNKKPYFSQGDIIEWERRNKKSIVIKVLKQHESSYDYLTHVNTITETYPNTYYRIELDKLLDTFSGLPGYLDGLMNYISRVEALEELGI